MPIPTYDHISVVIKDHVATLTFKRPDKANALNYAHLAEIEDAVLVPNRAVRLVDGDRVVYILREEKPEKIEIRLGSSSDTMSVVVGGDLKEGDLVILNPPQEFQGGGGPPF